MSLEGDSRKVASEYGGNYAVVCFDCQVPHEMTFPDGMQAEAFAAVMTRHGKMCPVCGGTTWVVLGEIGAVIGGERVRMLEAL